MVNQLGQLPFLVKLLVDALALQYLQFLSLILSFRLLDLLGVLELVLE